MWFVGLIEEPKCLKRLDMKAKDQLFGTHLMLVILAALALRIPRAFLVSVVPISDSHAYDVFPAT
jgi:hypothetical protein